MKKRRNSLNRPDVGRFGKLLRLRREAACLTQAELANLLGCSSQSICNWECGRAVPSGRHQRDALAALDSVGQSVAEHRRWSIIDRALEELP